MATWFLGKISHPTLDEQNIQRINREVYLVDAVSFTDAEAQLIRKLQGDIPHLKVEGVSKIKLSEVFMEGNDGLFFKMRVLYISFNERTQKEVYTPHTMLINAENPGDAYVLLKQKLGALNDYKITDINQSPIVRILAYEDSEKLEKIA
ncbi:DUF4494 family protein [Flectobacillus roseus]|uniref:DUF4494 family protein n=1 Tax=Flectobacillus roseus TaxID=502259 RepID=UPI0024B65968|nr:DUF4494 family protein [Flectobacillus roseus]MDI9872127.1 DUF4494 family protein [Flectobacillus roseus]